jgi:hypothetical protein
LSMIVLQGWRHSTSSNKVFGEVFGVCTGVKCSVLSGLAGTQEGSLHGWAGEHRSALGYQRDRTVPTNVECPPWYGHYGVSLVGLP